MKLLNTAKKITTAAALAAALLAGIAPKAAAQCPYTVGPLGRYIAPAIVQGMTATDDGAVEVWCTDALDGDDWYLWWTLKPICEFMTALTWWLTRTAPRKISAMTK